jgi:hypothetical protein
MLLLCSELSPTLDKPCADRVEIEPDEHQVKA